MPNLERPDLPGSSAGVAGPAGFGPIAAHWAPRSEMAGTYRGDYTKERWPGLPEDFNLDYFNAAPRDQQIEGFLRGDEELLLQNMHPQHPEYRTQLPGVRARLFLSETPESEPPVWTEVPLVLDTLWLNLDEEKANLIWRGKTNAKSWKLREIVRLTAFLELLSEPPRPAGDCEALAAQGPDLERKVATIPVPGPDPDQVTFDADFGQMDRDLAEMDAEFDRLSAQADEMEAQARAEAIAHGLDQKLLESQGPKTLEEAQEWAAADFAKLRATDPETAARIVLPDFGEAVAMQSEMDLLEKELTLDEPPRPDREMIQASPAKSFEGQDFSGLNLAGLDLSGADLSEASLRKANLRKAKLIGANLRGADLSGADLTEADLSTAILDDADLTKANLVGAKLAGVSIAGARLSAQELAGSDFSGAHGRGADFSKSNLKGSRFVGAQLPQADFSRAVVEQADFGSAGLQAAQFDAAKARGVRMEEADISGLHGGGKADFTEGNFRRTKGASSIWEQSLLDRADFSQSVLTRANFNEASLREARFDRADATKATFEDACVQKAVLTNANLLRASFVRADLTRADLSGANLYEAGFWETIFDHTVINGANVRGTLLA